MYWSYLLVGLLAYPLINRWQGRPSELRRVALVASVSILATLPYLWHLFANFYWGHGGAVAEKVWLQFGYEEGFFNFLSFTYEHGVLFLLSLLGMVAMARRRRPEDSLWLALLLGTVVGWAGYLVLFALQKIIEPDEFYFYARFLLAVAAGTGAFSVVRLWGGLASSSAPACIFLLVTLPQSFPYWWDPPKMDGYYEHALEPIPAEFERLGAFLRTNTSPDAVLVASTETSLWIASLSGRRVLTTGNLRPTFDYEDRVALEKGMLERLDPASYRDAMERYQVSHLVVDVDSKDVNTSDLDGLPWLDRVYADGVVVYAIRGDRLPGADHR